MNIGEHIKRLRKTKGWSQKDLGDRVGVLQTHVSKWENGMKPSAPYLPRIASALNVPISDLVGSTRPGKPNTELSGQEFRALCDLVDIINELPPNTIERIAKVLLCLSSTKQDSSRNES